MSRTSRDDAVNRIRKLLAMARDGSATEGEVENAMRMARELMDRFAVEDHELDGDRSTASRLEDIVQEPGDWSTESPPDRDVLLATACKDLCDVGCAVHGRQLGNGRWLRALAFYGLPRDVAVAHAMFGLLRSAMMNMARRRYGGGWRDEHSSYCNGFALRLAERANALAGGEASKRRALAEAKS